MSSNSSYQNFIINTLQNTASKTDIDSLIVFDEENNLTSGKFKTLFESPIQVIFNFDIGIFFISSTVNTSDKICVG